MTKLGKDYSDGTCAPTDIPLYLLVMWMEFRTGHQEYVQALS